jgi:hypothetical protein
MATGTGGGDMGDRLKADLGRIRQAPARLGRVEREFGDATQLAQGDSGYLGSAELASALDSFATGWSRRRAALIAQLADVARLSAVAADSCQGTDGKLTGAMRKAEAGS